MKMFAVLVSLFLFAIPVTPRNNICGYSSHRFVCCYGWSKNPSGECNIPVCTGRCGYNGFCVQPDVCRCQNGDFAFSCIDHELLNDGGSNAISGNPDMCINRCYDRGKCIGGRCHCRREFYGPSCQYEIRDFCFLNIQRGVCLKNEHILVMTKAKCCNALGVAWGSPCEKCRDMPCKRGFEMKNGRCVDINECEIHGVCSNGICNNYNGGFDCQCPSSFSYDNISSKCVIETKICKKHKNICGEGGTCIDLENGEYKCQCLWNYVLSSDKKKCSKKSNSKPNMCQLYGKYICRNGECIAQSNSYICRCNAGYVESADKKSCKKRIDFCEIFHGMLCKNGKCVNLDTDYMCQCDSGYTPSHDRKKCQSHCDLYPSLLCNNGKCIPQEGGYFCKCNYGYVLSDDKKTCESKVHVTNKKSAIVTYNYCSSEYYQQKCLGGRCINLISSYECICLDGYSRSQDGFSCQRDVQQLDEPFVSKTKNQIVSFDYSPFCVAYGQSLCTNGYCIQSGSAYECKCNLGFRQSSDKKQCLDINECKSFKNICEHGTCYNIPGSYSCYCNDGFKLAYIDKKPVCNDKNECLEDTSLCSNGKCVNLWGSYKCDCKLGFVQSSSKKQCLSSTKTRSRCSKCLWRCDSTKSVKSVCQCLPKTSQVLSYNICANMKAVQSVKAVTHRKSDASRLYSLKFFLYPNSSISDFSKSVQPLTINYVKVKCYTSVLQNTCICDLKHV